MRKTALHLWLALVKLIGGFGGLLIAIYLASDMVANETIAPPPVTPPPPMEVVTMVLLTGAVWGGLLLLGFLIASGFNSLSKYWTERWLEMLDYDRPGGH